jgi:hypothetical protein
MVKEARVIVSSYSKELEGMLRDVFGTYYCVAGIDHNKNMVYIYDIPMLDNGANIIRLREIAVQFESSYVRFPNGYITLYKKDKVLDPADVASFWTDCEQMAAKFASDTVHLAKRYELTAVEPACQKLTPDESKADDLERRAAEARRFHEW